MRKSATESNQRPAVGAEVRTAKVPVGPIRRMVRVAGQTAARYFASITAPIQRGPEGGRPLNIVMLAKGGTSGTTTGIPSTYRSTPSKRPWTD